MATTASTIPPTHKTFKLHNILSTDNDMSILESDLPLIDSDWIRSRFMTPDNDMPEVTTGLRHASPTSLKFEDSSLGGNIVINPRPQFTRYTDIRGQNLVRGRAAVTKGPGSNLGMGKYFSEALDDNQQQVFLEFGLPKFNSLTSFFTRAIDYNAATIANTGRKSTMYTVGQFVGSAIVLIAFPLVTISIWTIKTVFELFEGFGNYNYYYMEPMMHMYWGSVNTIVTHLATELGILSPKLMPTSKKTNADGSAKDAPNITSIGMVMEFDQEDIDGFKELLPGIIGDGNYIDVFAIAARAQTLANAQRVAEYEFVTEGSPITSEALMPSRLDKLGFFDMIDNALTFGDYLTEVVPPSLRTENGDELPVKKDPATAAAATTLDDAKSKAYMKADDGTYKQPSDPAKKSWSQQFLQGLDSTVRQGGAYAVFAVDYTGSVNESFSNSIGKINTGSQIKAIAGKSRDLKFDLAGGNITSGVDELLGGVKNLVAGALDSVTFGLSNVISTLTGGGYIEVPDKWDDSSMSLPKITYTVQLISPYGNTISQLQNMYIPLSMLLAGTLPISTGASSYTSPYLCSLYTMGVQKISMGMITSLSITRGTSNLAFNKDRRPLAIDVTFEVTDFSTLVTAPVNSSIFDTVFSVGLNDDSPFAVYLSVLGGRDILTNKYASHKMKLKLSRKLMGIEQAISPTSWSMRVGETMSSVLGPILANGSLTGKI